MTKFAGQTTHRGLCSWASLVVGLACWGCASPEGPGPLPLRSPPPFSASGETSPPPTWWLVFDDKALNGRVDRALGENFTLVAAWQRLKAAEAIADREASDLLPDLDAVGSAAWDDSAGDNDEGGDDNEGETELQLGLEATYEIDLWGRIESRVEAERLRASATLADYRTATITLTAELVRVWYQLVEAQMQLALIEKQVETNRKILDLLKTRFAAGRIRSADVLRQRQLVEATREQAVVVRSRVGVLEHLLAVLEGRAPQAEADMPDRQLPSLPPLPATGLPGELVQRRPDVQRALLLLRAADRDLASAVSDQYPRVSLSASLSTAAEQPENLFREWLASIAGQVVAPLFDGGQRRAEVQRTAAVARQRLAEYGQSVLTAFREVEDALVQERYQIDRIESLTQQLELARQTYKQLRTQYLNGVTDYIAVLDVLTEQQRLQRDLLTARLRRLEFRIALYRALAGGFETERERNAAGPPQERDPSD